MPRFSYFDDPDEFLELDVGLSGILRLSTKYNILPLRSKVIALYLTQFPSTLDKFDSDTSEEWLERDIIRLIALFRETNTLECLPSVLYLCSRFPMSTLLHGSDSCALSWEDKSMCIMGREELLQAQEDLSYSFIYKFQSPPNCASNGLCAKRARRNMYLFYHTRDRLTDVFALKEFTSWDLVEDNGICSLCVKKARSDHKAGRKAVWDLLPKFFGLGSWGEIKKLKESWNDEQGTQGN